MTDNEVKSTESECEQAEDEKEVQAEKSKEKNKCSGKAAKAENEKLKNENAVLKAEIESVKAELTAKTESYLRMSAEYDNYRKRTATEKAAIQNDMFAKAAVEFLPMADALDRAAQLSPEDEGAKALAKQLSDIFEKLGITPIESDGQAFDPTLHNAVMHEDDENQPENTVVATFQRGYMLGDKVIRHAMVKVVN